MPTPAPSDLIEGIDARVFESLCQTDRQREFMRNRYIHEVSHLARATRKSRRIYYSLSLISLGAAVTTSFVAALSVAIGGDITKWATAFLGLLTATSTGLFGLYKPWENWERRSMALEQLKYEGRMFAVGGGQYKSGTTPDVAFNTFVEMVEKIVSENKRAYFSSHQPYQPQSATKNSAGKK